MGKQSKDGDNVSKTDKKLTNSGMKNTSGMEVKIRPPVGRTSPEVVEAIVPNTVYVCVCAVSSRMKWINLF